MSDKSPIEWTDSTWNPIVGCSIVSPGCTNCYAMRMAARIEKMAQTVEALSNRNPSRHYCGLTKPSKAGPVWTGEVRAAPEDILLKPLHWKKPRRIFVNSMGDLFHEAITDEQIDRVFAVIALCPQHTFQVLTKRAERMRDYMLLAERKRIIAEAVMPISCMMAREAGSHKARIKLDHFSACFAGSGPFKNVWLGISAERQEEWDERKEHLRDTPAVVRFASFEPLLGPIREDRPLSDFIQLAIVGGESGPKARPMHPQWPHDLLDQCRDSGCLFFFKQWGEWHPQFDECGGQHPSARVGQQRHVFPRGPHFGTSMLRVGKKAAGRLLDGREHNDMPQRSSP